MVVYTTYIPLIYCLLGGYMLPTTFYGKGFAFMCSIGLQWRRGLLLGGSWKTAWVGSSQDGSKWG